MGQFSLVHWLILGVVLVLVFGGGRFSNMMGDVAKGIKSFKKGMAEEDEPRTPPSRIEGRAAPIEPSATTESERTKAE
jgi:sec-independent protein translocase protein TatA